MTGYERFGTLHSVTIHTRQPGRGFGSLTDKPGMEAILLAILHVFDGAMSMVHRLLS